MRDWMYMHRKGILLIHVKGQNKERFLNLCKAHSICLWNIKLLNEQQFEAFLLLSDFWNIRPIVKKSSSKIRVIKRIGLPFFFQRYKKRWIFLAALLFAVCILILLSGRIWTISIYGNDRVTEGNLRYYLKRKGIQCSMEKKELNCRKTADQIREDYDEFSWVSVRLEGTELMIEVKEGLKQKRQKEQVSEKAYDIIADREGEVIQIITRCGTPCVEKGDFVKKGDFLVKGEVEYLNDDKTITAVRNCQADADIYLKSVCDYKEVIPGRKVYRIYTGEQYQTKVYMIAGWNMSFPDNNRKFDQETSYTSYEYPSLMRLLNLPVNRKIIHHLEYKTILKNLDKKAMREKAEHDLYKFITKIKQKGVQIFQNDVRIDVDINSCVASGTLILTAKAGRKVERIPTE